MPPKLVVMCHVEPGTVRDGSILFDFGRPEGIEPALRSVAEFADQHGIRMGFVMTPQALSLSQTDLAGHDVGLHLHPMDPILVSRLRDRMRLGRDCLGRYSPPDQARLLDEARHVYEDALGRSPRLFVAGRWSENAATAALLREQGFTHDCSPLPGCRSSCVDWSRVERLSQPYAPQEDDYQVPGSTDFVYIPVSVGLWGHYLTPEKILPLGVSYFKAALKEAQVGGADVVHVFFHSPLALNPVPMEAFGQMLDYARDVLHMPSVLPTTVRPSEKRRSRPFPPAYWARVDLTLMKSFAGRRTFGQKIMGNHVPGPADEEPGGEAQDEVRARGSS